MSADKKRADKADGERYRGRTFSINDPAVRLIHNNSQKKLIESKRNRIILRRFRISYDENRIIIIHIQNSFLSFQMIQGTDNGQLQVLES